MPSSTPRPARAALNDTEAGIRRSPNSLTVERYLREWLETSVRPQLRPRTYDSYADFVDRYIVPVIGRIPLAKLEPPDVERMLGAAGRRVTPRGRPLSPTSLRHCYSVLRTALGHAHKQGLVVRNVATLVDAPRRSRPEIRPLNAEEARTFLGSVEGTPREALYVLALSTGMRQGELLGLRWQDLDLEAGLLTVRHTLRQGTAELGAPKSKRGQRTLRLPASALAALRRHKVAQLEQRLRAGSKWVDGEFVFATSHGTPLSARNLIRDFQAAIARAGLPRQRFHDLRHAYATLMLEAGEELAVVSRSLGHANLSTTADIYSHITPAMQQRTAARMDAILEPTGS